MIIDMHGHYTTAPAALETWRNRQVSAIDSKGSRPNPAEWAGICDELCFRASELFPDNFAGGACFRRALGWIPRAASQRSANA